MSWTKTLLSKSRQVLSLSRRRGGIAALCKQTKQKKTTNREGGRNWGGAGVLLFLGSAGFLVPSGVFLLAALVFDNTEKSAIVGNSRDPGPEWKRPATGHQ